MLQTTRPLHQTIELRERDAGILLRGSIISAAGAPLLGVEMFVQLLATSLQGNQEFLRENLKILAREFTNSCARI